MVLNSISIEFRECSYDLKTSYKTNEEKLAKQHFHAIPSSEVEKMTWINRFEISKLVMEVATAYTR